MGRRLFGTDGVRGVAGVEITAQLALALGPRGRELHSGLDAPRALVIRDTRESGEMLEAALAAGIASAGGEVALGGVLPTPAAPLLIARHGFDLAVVISASHNPYADNGIKFFGRDGFKLSDETEQEIELHIDEDAERRRPRDRAHPHAGRTAEDYLRELRAALRGPDRWPASTWCSTAPTAPPSRSRRRSSPASART
jgi:phosphoglucosamine mutase